MNKIRFLALASILSATAAHAETVEVHMKGEKGKFFYVPDTVTVKAGSTVKWVNDDPTKQMHTVTSGAVVNNVAKPDKLFDSKFIPVGKSFEHKFDKAGTYSYYCLPHVPMKMVGKVIVK